MPYKISTPKAKEQKTFEVKPKEDVKDSIKYLEKTKPNLSSHNYSWEVENGKLKLSLGNWSDVGWHWDGDEKDFVGYIHRINHSKEKENFLKDTENVSFYKLKPILLKSAETKDGLYEISGDNRVWHFGEIGEEEYNYFSEENFSEEQKNKFYEYYSPITYQEFEKDYGNQYKADVKKAINSSNSFKEFMDKMDELGEGYSEKVGEENSHRIILVIEKVKGMK